MKKEIEQIKRSKSLWASKKVRKVRKEIQKNRRVKKIKEMQKGKIQKEEQAHKKEIGENTLAIDFMASESEEEEEVWKDESYISEHEIDVSYYEDEAYQYDVDEMVDVEVDREE